MSPVFKTKLTRWLPAVLAGLILLTAWPASAQTPQATVITTPSAPSNHRSKAKPKLPDMIISNVTEDFSADNKTILFHVTLKNIGNVAGKPYAIVADLPDGPAAVSYLGADLDAKKEVTLNITIDNPRLAHIFRFYVDGTYLLKEIDENNNRSADIPVDGWLLRQKILVPNTSPFLKQKDDTSRFLLKP
jgi:hypothetical protein